MFRETLPVVTEGINRTSTFWPGYKQLSLRKSKSLVINRDSIFLRVPPNPGGGSQSLANPNDQKAGRATPICRYSAPYQVIRSINRSQRIEEQNNNPKTCKCCHVRIASGNLFCDRSVSFLSRRLVYLHRYVLHLEGWKIIVCSHLPGIPFSN